MRWAAASALVVLLAASARAAECAIWHVAAGGDGDGSSGAPFGRIQDALAAAQPGDTIVVGPGLYRESLRTIRGGTPEAPIRVRAGQGRRTAVVTHAGRVLRVDHPHIVVDGLVLDGQYGPADTVTIGSGAHVVTLTGIEVRRSSRDLIDIASPHGVLIEHGLIHHALNAAAGRADAHGIAAGAVRDLTIRDTEIHTFSGDGIQVDPGRLAPGWNNVTIERARIWLAPLPAPENGFAAGVVPGENAVDTKAGAAYARSRMVIRDTTASGFRNGLIANMAAFNLKEHVEVTVDRVTVSDSEIAFRLRGPRTAGRGARVTITNAVVCDTRTAYRYEEDIEVLNVWNSTVGRSVTYAFYAAASHARGLDVRNLLVLGGLPAEAAHPSNRGVEAGAFADAAAGDYTLAPDSPAIDAGAPLPAVQHDRTGIRRPQGRGHDIGAYEHVPKRGNVVTRCP